VVLRDAADHAAVDQLVQAVDGVHDVDVAREAGAVEVRAQVTELQVAGLIGDRLEVEVLGLPGGATLAYERGARDDGDLGVAQGWRLGERGIRELGHRRAGRVLAHGSVVVGHALLRSASERAAYEIRG
jgi:hypothetical protein